MKAQLVNPFTHPQWDELVLEHPESTIFHSAAWASVLSRTYRHKPLYLCGFHEKRLLAVVPMMEINSPLTGRRGVGLPFTDICEPLFFEERAIEFLVARLSDLAKQRRWKHFELRGAYGPQELQDSPNPYLAHTLDLRRNAETIFSGFSSANRRAIRKAEKSDLVVGSFQSREAIVEYYRLHIQTRKRHGVPPQPLEFFLNIHKELIARGLGFVVLAHLGTKPLAGAVFFHFGRNATYKFGASDEAHQTFRGNNLVMWEAIKGLKRQGIEALHFGRTSSGNKGLQDFKRGWGSQEMALSYFKRNTETGEWSQAKDRSRGLHNLIFGNLPDILNCMAGNLIYPHLD